jgi:glycosyltransferase involved in cell wall biosynthesis
MKTPWVSVIMPVFNTDKYVAQAIESVRGQTKNNLELICINDGSTDDSLNILKSFGDKIILLENDAKSGIAITRNKGLAVAKGEFVAFVDSDDIWKLNKLEKQLSLFEKNPKLDIAFTYMECFLSPEIPEEIKKIRYCPPGITPGYLPGTFLAKKSSFDKVGLFNTSLTLGEFIDWFAKAKELGLTHEIVPELLYLRRIHETNTGVNERPNRSDYLKVVKSALDRRRNLAKVHAESNLSKKLPE